MNVRPADIDAVIGAIEGMGEYNAEMFADLYATPYRDSVEYKPKESPNELSTFEEVIYRGWGSCDDIAAIEHGAGLLAGADTWVDASRPPGGPTHVFAVVDGEEIDPYDYYFWEDDGDTGDSVGAITTIAPIFLPYLAKKAKRLPEYVSRAAKEYVRLRNPRFAFALEGSGFSPTRPPRTLRDKLSVAKLYGSTL